MNKDVARLRKEKMAFHGIRKILIVSFFLMGSFLSFSQDTGGGSGSGTSEMSSRALTKAQRMEAKRKWKENRKREFTEKRIRKDHHKRIQTKDVQKRMKKSKKKSQQYNQRKGEPFYSRWFKKKK